jgi:8-oxo-dGTP pyrophosphatase MutT (NUDIX family)
MNSQRWKPSVTVAAIIERDGRFLLVEEQTPEGLCLNNPAGHLDPGESLLQAVVRECLEETACHFTPLALLGVYQTRFQRPARPGHDAEDVSYLRFAYAGTVGEPDAGRALDEPILRTLWLTPDEIRASVERHRSPLLLKCMEDFASGRRYALDAIKPDPTLYSPEIKR